MWSEDYSIHGNENSNENGNENDASGKENISMMNLFKRRAKKLKGEIRLDLNIDTKINTMGM